MGATEGEVKGSSALEPTPERRLSGAVKGLPSLFKELNLTRIRYQSATGKLVWKGICYCAGALGIKRLSLVVELVANHLTANYVGLLL